MFTHVQRLKRRIKKEGFQTTTSFLTYLIDASWDLGIKQDKMVVFPFGEDKPGYVEYTSHEETKTITVLSKGVTLFQASYFPLHNKLYVTYDSIFNEEIADKDKISVVSVLMSLSKVFNTLKERNSGTMRQSAQDWNGENGVFGPFRFETISEKTGDENSRVLVTIYRVEEERPFYHACYQDGHFYSTGGENIEDITFIDTVVQDKLSKMVIYSKIKRDYYLIFHYKEDNKLSEAQQKVNMMLGNLKLEKQWLSDMDYHRVSTTFPYDFEQLNALCAEINEKSDVEQELIEGYQTLFDALVLIYENVELKKLEKFNIRRRIIDERQ